MTSTGMASSLLSLPTEIILKIIESIGIEDVNEDIKALNCLATTSKQSLILVEAAVGSLKELLSLERRFGRPEYHLRSLDSTLGNRQDLLKLFPNITSGCMGPDLSYLSLNGDLSWLPPLDSVIASNLHPFRSIMTTHELNRLVKESKQLHLKLPTSFVTLMGSAELQNRAAYSCAVSLNVGSLIKCPSNFDRNAGGFILRVLSDELSLCYSYLYFDPMGQHCVFNSQDAENNGNEDIDTLRSWAEVVFLGSLKFEQFLYHAWMDELCYWALPEEKNPSEAQRAYLEGIKVK